jgi:hypothetical protein
MAKDCFSGLLLQGDALEWTTLQGGKDRLKTDGTKRAQLPAPGAAGPPGPEASAARAAMIRAECAGLKPPVALGLPSDQALLRVVSLPTTDDAELAGMVQLQVDKLSPFPVEAMVVAYEILARRNDGRQVLIAAARTETVDALGAMLAAAGLRAARVDVAALGWWRLLADAGEIPPQGRQLVLLLHEGAPEVIVFEDALPIAFHSLSGLASQAQAEWTRDMAHEVGYTLLSVELEHGSAACPISVWHPEGAEPAGLLAALRRERPQDVSSRSLSVLGGVSAGLARRLAAGPGRLDLTPAVWRTSAQARGFRKRMLLAAGGLLALWGLAVAAVLGGLSFEKIRLSGLKAQEAVLHPAAVEVKEMRRRVRLIQGYMNRTDSALECLREVCASLPDGIEFPLLSYRKGEGVKISGVAQSVEQVYDFKKSLDASPLFRKVVLKGPVEQSGKQRFDLDLIARGAAE